jgi:CRP-like cAMP-binding protein
MSVYAALYTYFHQKTGISESSFEPIAKCFTELRCKPNEMLLKAGETCRYNYFIGKGCIRMFARNEMGEEQTRYFAFEGKFGTALSSFIEQKPSTEFIQSLEPTVLLSISRDNFFELVNRNPSFAAVYRNILEMAYITAQQRIYGLQGDSALERLNWLLNYNPDIFKRLSSKIIATFLGVTPHTLSRLKTSL